MFSRCQKHQNPVKKLNLVSIKALTLTLLLVFITFLNTSIINANEDSKKYNLSICTIFKNEAKNLKEWIEYHQKLGVDHFYLYDTGSRDAYQSVLKPYIDEGIVTLVHWPAELCRQCENSDDCKWALSSQIPAYENAVNFVAKEETEWLILLDVNENMICSEGTIKDLLTKYQDYSGIACSSFFFDAPIQDNFLENKHLAKSLELKPSLEKTVVKMIFKPADSEGFMWPPYRCRFSDLQATTEVTSKELCIDRIVRRNEKEIPSRKRLKHKKIAEYQLHPEKGLFEFSKNDPNEQLLDFTSKSLSHPMYHPTLPDFLKKIILNNKEID